MFNFTDLSKIAGLNKFFVAFMPMHGASNNFFEILRSLATSTERQNLQSPIDFSGWLPKLSFGAFDFGSSPLENTQRSQPSTDQYDLNGVFDAMMLLPKDQRNLLIMININEMRYADVAKKLNISVDAVRSRLSGAREALENILSNGPSAEVEEEIEIVSLKGTGIINNQELIKAAAANDEMSGPHNPPEKLSMKLTPIA